MLVRPAAASACWLAGGQSSQLWQQSWLAHGNMRLHQPPLLQHNSGCCPLLTVWWSPGAAALAPQHAAAHKGATWCSAVGRAGGRQRKVCGCCCNMHSWHHGGWLWCRHRAKMPLRRAAAPSSPSQSYCLSAAKSTPAQQNWAHLHRQFWELPHQLGVDVLGLGRPNAAQAGHRRLVQLLQPAVRWGHTMAILSQLLVRLPRHLCMHPMCRPTQATNSGPTTFRRPAQCGNAPPYRPPARPLDLSAGAMLPLPRLSPPVGLQVPAGHDASADRESDRGDLRSVQRCCKHDQHQ